MTIQIAFDYRKDSSARRLEFIEERLTDARDVFQEQAKAIAQLANRIDRTFSEAVDLLYQTDGHVVICGMGKSGLIGKKIAATLASTGTPSFFLHPGEAYHGDLGMVTKRDTVVLISYSGETEEVVRLIPHLKEMGVPLISLVGAMDSTLARSADVALDCSVEKEVCPNNLAPTCSTLAAMAMGDALSVALMQYREFQPRDFARFHPGGSLGRKLLTRVRDAMYDGHLPVVSSKVTVRESLIVMTRGRLGTLLVMDGPRLRGIITDGDLRRAMQRHDDVLDIPVSRIMTKNPVTIGEDVLLSEAEELMRQEKIKLLVVLDPEGQVSGILDIFG